MKVFQIYYQDDQLPALDYIPYKNEDCTVFFENSVICDLINRGVHRGQDYFGVVSYQLRHKVTIAKTIWPKNIANISLTEFTPLNFHRELLKGKPDAMSFQRHPPHDPIMLADHYHPGFKNYFQELLKRIGYNWQPMDLPNVFYCNYFVAKAEVYEDYVKNMLQPFMNAMGDMPDLLSNSNYPKPLREELKKKFGLQHYPFHPFLCERLFSYYAYQKKLTCLHY